jgi:hypothetical protein
MMDEGKAWRLTKLVFWSILIFVVLKLGLALVVIALEQQQPLSGVNPDPSTISANFILDRRD